jgi:uncharacterized protein
MAVKDFSVEERLVSLLNVQKIDSKIDEINKLRGELPMEVKDLEDEIEGLRTRSNLVLTEIEGINDFIKQKEDEKAEAADLLKRYEKQQSDVKNSREFEAINKELEMQDLNMKACDRHIKDAKEDIIGLENKLEVANEKLANKEDVLAAKRIELEKIIAENEKEEQVLLDKVVSAKEHVEPRLLMAYEKLRTNFKNGIAVASIDRNSCGGCFNTIPPQRQAEIRMRKKVIVCEHCSRVLIDSELYYGTEQ